MEPVLTFLSQIAEWANPLILFALAIKAGYDSVAGLFKSSSLKRENKQFMAVLTDIANKDNCKNEVLSLSNKITDLSAVVETTTTMLKQSMNQNILLAQMLTVIFEHSTLPIEVKEHLESLRCTIEYGQEADYIETILKENAALKDTLDKLKTKTEDLLNAVPVDEPKEPTHKNTYVQVV